MQMVALGKSILFVSFEHLAHFIIVASQRVELDLNGLKLEHCIGPVTLKQEFSETNPKYERNVRLLFMLAKVGSS